MTVRALRQVSDGVNGVGAFILQCKRMEFTFCNRGGSSIGMRKYIERFLPEFAYKHPGIEIIVAPRPNHHPAVTGFYINGGSKPVCVRNLDPLQIVNKVTLVRDANGEKLKKVNKAVTSLNPSVRGIWSPYHGEVTQV
jgi:large subunit ribosomal protein L43